MRWGVLSWRRHGVRRRYADVLIYEIEEAKVRVHDEELIDTFGVGVLEVGVLHRVLTCWFSFSVTPTRERARGRAGDGVLGLVRLWDVGFHDRLAWFRCMGDRFGHAVGEKRPVGELFCGLLIHFRC